MPNDPLTRFFLSALAGCCALGATRRLVAQAPDATAASPKVNILAAVPHGRLESVEGSAGLAGEGETLRIIRLWGTHAQRGRAHGALLAKDIVELVNLEFGARFGGKAQRRQLDVLRRSAPRLVGFPDGLEAELDGMMAGLEASGVDLTLPALERSLDRRDLVLAAALDAVGFACSGFTVWGDKVVGGGVLSGRNFDWPLSGPHLLNQVLVMVHHPAPEAEGEAPGTPWATVGWPGYLGAVTAVNAEGAAVYLHTGNGQQGLPQPESWPTAIASREILERSGGDGAARAVLAEELLGYTSPPSSYITRLVAPQPLRSGSPVLLLEADIRTVTTAALPLEGARVEGGSAVVTNHFQGREDLRAGRNSSGRWSGVTRCLADCFAEGDRAVSVAEGWDALDGVAVGNTRFGTLHSLVFRADPWVYELRVGVLSHEGVILPATRSPRRYDLPRAALFPSVDPTTPTGS